MPTRDPEGTKARILEAAVAEFAEHGCAGARVDRIAESACANKRMLYVYFGNKNELFDAVIESAVGDLHESVPFNAHDLPDYGGRLFDFLVARPVELRIAAWRQLERPCMAQVELDMFEDKIAALDKVRATSAAETSSAETPSAETSSADLLVAILAIAWSWVTVPHALGSLASPDNATRRKVVVGAIAGLCVEYGLPVPPASAVPLARTPLGGGVDGG